MRLPELRDRRSVADMRPTAFVLALLISLPRLASAQADTVRGVVYDSLAATPLVGAFVTAEAGASSTVTDSLGQFVLVSGTRVQRVVVYHDVLDRLGLTALVALRDGAGATAASGSAAPWLVRLGTPSIGTLWQKLCAGKRPTDGLGGIVVGSARFDDDSTRVAGARVVVEWESLRRMAVTPAPESPVYEHVVVRTDSTGEFVACGVQEFGQAGVAASAAEFRSGSALLTGDVRPIRRVDLVLAAASARAAFTGTVTDETGRAVSGATVQVDGVDEPVLTTDGGRFAFAAVPTGTRMLGVRKVGYLPTVQQVDVLARGLRDVPLTLERGITLDGVKVTARATVSRDRQEVEERRLAGFAQVMDSTRVSQYPLLQSALRMFPSLVVQTARTGTEFVLLGRLTEPGVRCRVHIWVDGAREDEQYLRLLPLESIAAVELFNSDAFAPARFRSFGDTCNTLLVWTKGYLNG